MGTNKATTMRSNRWGALRYRGDAQDVERLQLQYNVQGFLDARAEGERERLGALRASLLKDGVLLTEAVSPRIHGIVRGVQSRLGLDGGFEVFCTRDEEVNAFASLGGAEDGARPVIALTSGALEKLEDAEIASILGHEFGHGLQGHTGLLGLENRNREGTAATVLPYLGECLYLRWRKKSEISADRIGLVACDGSFEASARALLKAGFGLSGKNLNLDVNGLLAQIERIRDRPDAVEAAFRSHPLLPLRLKALELFVAAGAGAASDLGAVDDEIDRLFGWFKRSPRTPLQEAVMRVVALGGLRMLGSDRDFNDEEIRTVIYVLHQHFTDEPETELLIPPDEQKRRWTEAVARVRSEGGEAERIFILSRLADIALADGKLFKEESACILSIAQEIGVPPQTAYGIIIGAAQAVGFRIDTQMNDLVRSVRRKLADAVLAWR